jgi:beta-glucosidase
MFGCREDFRAYAEVCFREFGDRVKFWTTFNEANGFTTFGYDVGFWPPKRCSYPFGFVGNCSAGNSTVEPYIAGHYVLLSHAATVELYRQKFQVLYCNHVKFYIVLFFFRIFWD